MSDDYRRSVSEGGQGPAEGGFRLFFQSFGHFQAVSVDNGYLGRYLAVDGL